MPLAAEIISNSQAFAYAIVILAALTGIAGVLHAIATVFHARAAALAAAGDAPGSQQQEALALKLEAAEHLLEGLVSVGEKHAAGESFFQAGLELVESAHGQQLGQLALERIRAAKASPAPSSSAPGAGSSTGSSLALVLLAGFLLGVAPGCSAAQLARDEQAAHAALSKLETGVDWLNANPVIVAQVLDDAGKASSDPGFTKAIDKAKAAVAAGDLQTAQHIIALGRAITAPASSPDLGTDLQPPPAPLRMRPNRDDLPTPLRPPAPK